MAPPYNDAYQVMVQLRNGSQVVFTYWVVNGNISVSNLMLINGSSFNPTHIRFTHDDKVYKLALPDADIFYSPHTTDAHLNLNCSAVQLDNLEYLEYLLDKKRERGQWYANYE